MSLLNDCPTCYPQKIMACVQELVFAIGLPESTNLIAVFTTPRDKVLPIEVETDADGTATIDVTDLPLGLFETFDNIDVQFVTELGCTPLIFSIDDIDYECITLLPQDCDSAVDTQTIPC